MFSDSPFYKFLVKFKLGKFIIKYWNDPVWSKVFSFIIISSLGIMVTLIVSLWNNINVVDLWNKLISTLESKHVTFSYLTLTIVGVLLLSALIPMITLGILKIQLKNTKVPMKLKTTDFNLETFINGKWRCEYKPDGGNTGGEDLEIKEGNKYLLNGKLYFVLTDISFDQDTKILKWSKMNLATYNKHSSETLKIVSDKILQGSDDQGYTINYYRK